VKTILIFFVLLVGGIVCLHHCLQNGSVLRYIDKHPNEKGVPEATYYIGQGYYLLQDLQTATTYFFRAAQRYSDSALGDNASFAYLQCLDDSVSLNRSELIAGYKTYLEKYANGHHADLAKSRLDSYSTGGR